MQLDAVIVVSVSEQANDDLQELAVFAQCWATRVEYPITVNHDGAIDERWSIVFTGPRAVTINEHCSTGQIEPSSPASATPTRADPPCPAEARTAVVTARPPTLRS